MEIAVICAFPTHENPGMLSVDMSFKAVLQELGSSVQATYFCVEQEFKLQLDKSPLHYNLLSNVQQLRKFDRIIYWGDFLHWIEYARTDMVYRELKRLPSSTPEALLDKWFQLLLLEGASKTLQRKVIVFGGTLYGLSAQQLADTRYRQALTALYRHASLVLMRDPLSANLVTQLSPNHENTFGCDCALLFDERLYGLDRPQKPPELPQRYMLCSFGRSGADQLLYNFAKTLAARLGIAIMAVDWLGNPTGVSGLVSKLSVVRAAEFILTDIYHLAVCAWREGVPAFAVGRGSSHVRYTVSDKKKEIFFRQIFAPDYYLYLEDIMASRQNANLLAGICDTVAAGLGAKDALQFIFDTIRLQKQQAMDRLIPVLRA